MRRKKTEELYKVNYGKTFYEDLINVIASVGSVSPSTY